MSWAAASERARRKVMLVGGGRWGRTHAGVLSHLLPDRSEILWVSRHSHPTLPAPDVDRHRQVSIRVFDDINEAMQDGPDAAIIATAAHTHARLARIVLANDISVLVEKPFVMDSRVARELIQLADDRGLVLCVGLHLFFASYLPYFRSFWRDRPVAAVRLAWFDCESELRYGETKRSDAAVPLVHDVFPHLWTILRVLFPGHEPRLGNVLCLERGSAGLDLSTAGLLINAQIGRRAPARLRRIDLDFQDGGTASLDFTLEPGTVVIDGNEAAGDPDWGRMPTPLSGEVANFLAMSAKPALAAACPGLAADVITSVTGAEEAAGRFAAHGVQKLARLIVESPNPFDAEEIRFLLIDSLVPELCGAGIRIDPAEYGSLVRGGLSVLDGKSTMADEDVRAEIDSALQASDFLRQVAIAIRSRQP